VHRFHDTAQEDRAAAEQRFNISGLDAVFAMPRTIAHISIEILGPAAEVLDPRGQYRIGGQLHSYSIANL
jgi:hypothetical protein